MTARERVGRQGKWVQRRERLLAGRSVNALRRGRHAGIAPERRRALAELVARGWTLQEIANALGVTRQCIHAQLRKCPELEAARRAEKAARVERLRRAREVRHAVTRLKRAGERGQALLRFLQFAQLKGWAVELAPRRRPRVNGVPVAVHCPRRLRAATVNGAGQARYFHVRIAHPEWLNVIVFPTGQRKIFLPGELRHAGSLYLPAASAVEKNPWPRWQVFAPSGPGHGALTQKAA